MTISWQSRASHCRRLIVNGHAANALIINLLKTGRTTRALEAMERAQEITAEFLHILDLEDAQKFYSKDVAS